MNQVETTAKRGPSRIKSDGLKIITETMTKICPNHGPYTGKVRQMGSIRTEPMCPKCFEAKRDDMRKRGQLSEFGEGVAAQNKLAARFKQSGIPKRFQSRHFDNYQTNNDGQQRALMIAKSYAENFDTARSEGACLCFTGEPGTGKTHLAAAIGNFVITNGGSALFSTAYRAVGRFKDSWRSESELNEEQVLKQFLEPDLVILDEIGVQFSSNTERIMLFNIINGRYEEMRPTIIISNLPLMGLIDCLGSRAVDRLKENGGAIIEFNWKSYRR